MSGSSSSWFRCAEKNIAYGLKGDHIICIIHINIKEVQYDILEATIQTLTNLGCEASYSDIYEEYEKVVGHSITKNQQQELEPALNAILLTQMYLRVMIYFIPFTEKEKGIGGCVKFNIFP